MSRSDAFTPVFIVGAPRSGTTLLAVLLNRHSRLAIPPETQFFTTLRNAKNARILEGADRAAKVDLMLGHERIRDLCLDPAALSARFACYENNSRGLFQAMLETYGAQQNKPRVGEKTPKHIEYVNDVFQYFPEARILCIVRDGRDVVRSLLKTSWAEPGNPRRFGLFCCEWAEYARVAVEHSKRLTRDRFLVVRYEDVLLEPELMLRKICRFLDEDFEPGMLDASAAVSGVVPSWETDWKAKADKKVDPARAFAWRTQAKREEIWWMNVMMGRELRLLGYDEAGLAGCPLWRRIVLHLQMVPYLRMMRPVSLFGLKLLRLIRGEQKTNESV